MSGLYLYCIAPAGHDPAPGLRGLDDRPVRGRTSGPFRLWVSASDEAPAATVERARRHNLVVTASLGERVTPIPARFGQWFARPADLDERLERRREEYVARLRAIAGAVEFGGRVVDARMRRADGGGPARDEAEPKRVASGTAYLELLARRLEARRAARARSTEIRAWLRDGLGPLVREDRAEPDRDSPGLVTLAHLVARADADAYRRRVRRLAEGRPELRLVVTGPWPPYSFTG